MNKRSRVWVHVITAYVLLLVMICLCILFFSEPEQVKPVIILVSKISVLSFGVIGIIVILNRAAMISDNKR